MANNEIMIWSDNITQIPFGLTLARELSADERAEMREQSTRRHFTDAKIESNVDDIIERVKRKKEDGDGE